MPGQGRGPDWPRYDDRREYLTEPIGSGGGDIQPGRHRSGYPGPPARSVLWDYQRAPGGAAPARRDPRGPYGAPVMPPDRLEDYRPTGPQASLPAPPGPLSYPPAPYQEGFPVSGPGPGYPPAVRPERALPAVAQSGVVSKPQKRVRGMNAALESGVAGVGEMVPARPPARPRQLAVAAVVAVVGLAAAALTYRSLATGPASFGGEVVPAHVYALSFGSPGAITALRVDAGDHVTAGEVLATQDDSLARANLQAAKDSEAVAASSLSAGEHSQPSGVTAAQDAVTSAQASLNSVMTRVAGTNNRDKEIIGQRQQAVNAAATALATQCGTATTSAACQALATKLSTAKQELTQAQTAATTAQTAGQQQVQAAQGKLSERQAALRQVQAQGGGASMTLDQARQRLAAAKAAVAQDEIALRESSITAPASGTVGAVSAAAGDSITGGNVHDPVLTVNSGPMIVSAHLPGSAIGAVQAGQLVTLGIGPLHVSLPGKVIQVNQVASASQTAVSYVVICQIERPDPRLMAGMTADITLR